MFLFIPIDHWQGNHYVIVPVCSLTGLWWKFARLLLSSVLMKLEAPGPPTNSHIIVKYLPTSTLTKYFQQSLLSILSRYVPLCRSLFVLSITTKPIALLYLKGRAWIIITFTSSANDEVPMVTTPCNGPFHTLVCDSCLSSEVLPCNGDQQLFRPMFSCHIHI